jgi:hypothetical protein
MYEGVGEYGIPSIQPIYEVPSIDRWLEFEKAKKLRHKPKKTGVHFFEYDFKFECVWNFPDRYAEVLSQYDCVLSPDFSIYVDIPRAVQIFNHYRKHWLAAYWQDKGITIIPTVRWGWEDSYDFCFDGEPMNSVIAVSNVGCTQDKEMKKMWMQGYEKMLEVLNPKEILVYTNSFNYLPGNVRYIKYSIDKRIDEEKEEDDD